MLTSTRALDKKTQVRAHQSGEDLASKAAAEGIYFGPLSTLYVPHFHVLVGGIIYLTDDSFSNVP